MVVAATDAPLLLLLVAAASVLLDALAADTVADTRANKVLVIVALAALEEAGACSLDTAAPTSSAMSALSQFVSASVSMEKVDRYV